LNKYKYLSGIMRYSDLERLMSAERMGRYLQACHNDSRKAMTLIIFIQ